MSIIQMDMYIAAYQSTIKYKSYHKLSRLKRFNGSQIIQLVIFYV